MWYIFAIVIFYGNLLVEIESLVLYILCSLVVFSHFAWDTVHLLDGQHCGCGYVPLAQAHHFGESPLLVVHVEHQLGLAFGPHEDNTSKLTSGDAIGSPKET